MDTITHIVLGATLGDAILGRRLGKKAMVLGAVAQSLPDIDFVASFWLDTPHDVYAHRGITHSLLFVLVLGLLLAGASAWKYKEYPISRQRWLFFWSLQLLVHIVLDAFNAYGTGWFEPFSHHRFSFNVLFVADPFFSVWLGISFLALLILKKDNPARKGWIGFGLILSCSYLGYCIINKNRIASAVQKELQRQQITETRFFTTPTPMNSWLWYIVVADQHGYYTGYRSVFDKQPTIDFHYFPRNDSLLTPFRKDEGVRPLLKFCQGYYTIDRWKGGGLVFNDLRFGQIKGWEDGQAPFVFHYFLEHPDDNTVIVQRGRFAGWNRQTVRDFIKRIGGIKIRRNQTPEIYREMEKDRKDQEKDAKENTEKEMGKNGKEQKGNK
ncbi:metal-dependent hydrolase [Flavitalea flava]